MAYLIESPYTQLSEHMFARIQYVRETITSRAKEGCCIWQIGLEVWKRH